MRILSSKIALFAWPIRLLWLGVFFNLNVQAQEGSSLILSLSKNTFLSSIITKKLISNRCEIYQPSSTFLSWWENFSDPLAETTCEKASRALFNILDIKTIATDDGFMGRAIFSSKLMAFLNQTNTRQQLLKILKLQTEGSGNIFASLNKAPFAMTVQDATEFLAVLFQDTNGLHHLFYLELLQVQMHWKPNDLEKENLQLLKTANENFQQAFYFYQGQALEGGLKYLQLFPINSSTANWPFQPALYHFYVPAYLALQLKAAKFNDYQSFISPFLLRVLYEQLFTAQTQLTDKKTALTILNSYDAPVSSSYKQHDLYLSLSGAFWALKKNTPFSLQEFKIQSSNNLGKMLRLMSKTL